MKIRKEEKKKIKKEKEKIKVICHLLNLRRIYPI